MFIEARTALDQGLAIAQKNGDSFAEAELHRLQGELLALSDDQAGEAEEAFRLAIETARRQQSKAWELRATISMARLLKGKGRSAEAHRALAAIWRHTTKAGRLLI
jgi:hypothetical protein